MLLAAVRASASPPIELRARCASTFTGDRVHLRTLRDELTQALVGVAAAPGAAIDVSLTRVTVTPAGSQLEVRVELRALLSDEKGRLRWATTTRSTARGDTRDRELLLRDAVSSAARDLGRRVREMSRR